jgi:hypothetical protein
MAAPRLTFFSELKSEELKNVFTDQIISDLVEMQASVSLGILDLSPARARVVRKLNQAGIPVVGWLLLPKDQGYWFNLRNAPQAQARYRAFKQWTDENGLRWDGVGLDIEPDIRDLVTYSSRRMKILPLALQRVFHFRQVRQGKRQYRELVDQIHADGYRVDSYQLPFIVDERRARSTLLQRITGIVDLPVDREVWMLYSSFVRPHGAAILASYASEAQAVGLGVTGGGVDEGFTGQPPLTWDELARDLRLAWYYCDDLHVFSLEGCVQQGYLTDLKDFIWDAPILTPEDKMAVVENWRWLLRIGLWFVSHIGSVVMITISAALLGKGIKRLLKNK